MKIGMFTDRYLPQTDGVSVSVEITRAQLEAMGHDVYVIAPKPSFRYKDTNARVLRLPGVKGLWGQETQYTSFFLPPRTLRQIGKLDLDVFHVHTPGQIGLFGIYCGEELKKPLVATYHTDMLGYVEHYASWETLPAVMALRTLAASMTGGGLDEYRKTFVNMRPNRSLESWIYQMVKGLVLQINNHCDLVIAPSEKMRLHLIELGTTSRIVTLPSGIDRISVVDKDLEYWRATIGLRPHAKVVLYVGRLGTEKNIGLLIRAFETIARRDHEVKLVIVGPGDKDDVMAFKAQARATKCADRIIFTGNVDRSQLGALYELATVLGFPSLTDTQSLVINEAVAAGRPVVLVDGGITSAVVDGENGYLARPVGRDFANKLLRVLSDEALQRRFSEKSLALAENFTLKAQAKSLLELYREVIAQHRVGAELHEDV